MTPSIAAALCDPGCYPHPCGRIELVETHISWVLLAGAYAYKIKKPVNLGFLDFSTLEARRRCCEAELRLNRRTAPGLYLGVVPVTMLPITGGPDKPFLGGPGEAIEYAVKMRRFPDDALLDRMARRGAIDSEMVDRLGRSVAAFHASAEVAGEDTAFGSPGEIASETLDNFDAIAQLGCGPSDAARLERLRRWSEAALAQLARVFAERKAGGCVRECHGDLHLGNIALIDGAPVPFDCIEFNEAFRFIDVMSEVAFLVMDLDDHGLAGLAWCLLNVYLEESGDYAGIAVLRHYLVYRAMVRAKIARIRTRQGSWSGADYLDHVRLAEKIAGSLTAPGAAQLILMHGVSGSGKTTVAQRILERIGAVRVRSDVERKRLHGLRAGDRSEASLGGEIYGAQSSRITYARLAEVARATLAAGWPSIVDATFLARADRDAFRRLALEMQVPLRIVSCRSPEPVLRERIVARQRQANDASEANLEVLERQLATEEPLREDELGDTFSEESIA